MTIEWNKETKKPKKPSKYLPRRNEILKLYYAGKNQNQIAKQIGVSRQDINQIVKGMMRRGAL